MWQKEFNKQTWKYAEEISWAQWNRFGLLGTGVSNTYSTDLECALLLAAYTTRRQGRLWDGIYSWLQEYRELVNRERLANLLKQFRDPWLFRCMGALFEKLEHAYWKGIVLLCNQNFSPKANSFEPFLQGVSTTKWVQDDPVFKKWNLLKAEAIPRKKLQPLSQIMARNALFRYRFLMTLTARPDILYLLSISHHLKTRKETDVVTNDRCTQILRYDPSSIHRIQKDFEKAKLLEPVFYKTKQRSIKTTPWKVLEKSVLFASQPLENGMMDWYRFTHLILQLFHLPHHPGFESNDIIAKSHLYEHLMNWIDALQDYELPLPAFSKAEKLEKFKAPHLALELIQILKAFLKWITNEA